MIAADAFESALDAPSGEMPPPAAPVIDHEPETPVEPQADAEKPVDVSPESEAGRTLAAAKRSKEGRKQSIQREIDDLVRQRADTQRERDRIASEVADLERKKAALSAAPKAEPKSDDPEPKEDDFETYGAFTRAVAKWEARQAVKEATEHSVKARQAYEKERTAHERRTKHDARIEAFRATRPDFDDVMAAADDIRLSPPMIDAIVESEIGPQLMVHLAEHPDDYRRILQLGESRPLMAYREMSKLEARLEAAATGPAPVAPVSQAKPPLKPVGSAPSTGEKSDASEEMDVEEFIRVGNLAERKRLGR